MLYHDPDDFEPPNLHVDANVECYIRLWAHVAQQAMLDYKKGNKQGWYDPVKRVVAMRKEYTRERLLEYDSAKTWMFSDSTRHGSFLWVCSILNFDPIQARQCVAIKEK